MESLANSVCTHIILTLISTPSTVSSERRIGLPTKLGKMAVGKLAPAKPHLTNCKNNHYKFI
jgi:hypothetical protein